MLGTPTLEKTRHTAGLRGLRWPAGSAGWGVVNAVVVELDVLNQRMAAIRCDAVDEGDDAFPPLADLDLLRTVGRLHGSLRRRFGLLDCVGIGIGLDGEAVIRAARTRS